MYQCSLEGLEYDSSKLELDPDPTIDACLEDLTSLDFAIFLESDCELELDSDSTFISCLEDLINLAFAIFFFLSSFNRL